ncbi:MAG: hypothetical protein L0I24_02790 [Pseudonocardia sp.]|nr:hypothetical protein [Pseudonocardia sp.]
MSAGPAPRGSYLDPRVPLDAQRYTPARRRSVDLGGRPQLQTRGVDLVVLDQGINTSTAVGRMFFQILGSIVDPSNIPPTFPVRYCNPIS